MTERDPNLSSPPVETNGEITAVQTRSVDTPRRGNATRWGIALVVLALAIGVAAAAVFLLAGRESPSGLVGYAPKDASSWVEARLDLPGDQRQKLADVLAKFPGFADQSTLETKLDEALDRLVRSATQDEQDYATKIKPWFGGQIGVASGPLPDLATPQQMEPGDARVLGLVTVTDATKARAWFDEVVGETPTSTETYGEVELTLIGEDRIGAMAIAGGRVMILGDVTSVKAAIDSRGEGGLSADQRYLDAQAALTGDSLVTFWQDTRASTGSLTQMLEQGEADPALAAFVREVLEERVPAWTAGQVRADGDAFVADLVNPHVSAGPTRTNRISAIVDNLPQTSIAVLDAHDFGATALDAVALLRRVPGSEETFRQVDATVGIIGGLDAAFRWMGDTAIVVTRDGDEIGGGLAAAPVNAQQAADFVTSIKSLLVLGGSQLGVTTREESYAGTTITHVEMSGASAGLPEAPSSLAFAATDQVVVIGIGDAFVKAVLDTQPGSSLADADRYRTLIERVGAENFSSVWLDVTAVREVAERLMRDQQDTDLSSYERDIKPYVTPFDALVGASRLDGELDRSTVVFTVK